MDSWKGNSENAQIILDLSKQVNERSKKEKESKWEKVEEKKEKKKKRRTGEEEKGRRKEEGLEKNAMKCSRRQ